MSYVVNAADLGLLVFELEPMYVISDGRTDGRTTDADHRIMPPGRGHNKRHEIGP